MLNHLCLEYDYLKRKFEFSDDELRSLSDLKLEIIKLVARDILINVCKELCM